MTNVKNLSATFLAATAIAAATPASAATLIVDENGQLRGASGVNVEGALYDVEFADGSCVELFSGCDEVADFTFTSDTSALAAAQAILDQIFLVSNIGSSMINGCEGSFCGSLIPSTLVDDNSDLFLGAVALNLLSAPNEVRTAAGNRERDYSESARFNYAVFTPTQTIGAVPEPGTWMLLMLGFFAAGAALRHKASIRSLSVRYT